MILTDEDLRAVQQLLEERSGLDQELVDHCRPLLRTGAVDDAVRSAFVILEGRLRHALGGVRGSGVDLAQRAFAVPNGELAKRLGLETPEKEGLRDLFVGAFKFLRNPVAHGEAAHPVQKAQAIISHVNLLLLLLSEIPPPLPELPRNVETLLSDMEKAIGPGATSRLRVFLHTCRQSGVSPSRSAKTYIPFKRPAWIKLQRPPEPKSCLLTMFYLIAERTPRLSFPVNTYYPRLKEFDFEALKDELLELGFQPYGKRRDLEVELQHHNDDQFFNGLAELVQRTSDRLEEILAENA